MFLCFLFLFFFCLGLPFLALFLFCCWIVFVVVLFFAFIFLIYSFVFRGGFKGQVRWSKGPPHLVLNPPCF